MPVISSAFVRVPFFPSLSSYQRTFTRKSHGDTAAALGRNAHARGLKHGRNLTRQQRHIPAVCRTRDRRADLATRLALDRFPAWRGIMPGVSIQKRVAS